ncbi:hypothetical protein ACFQZT_25590 [Paenibacillus sp. GCM10027628]|uniref:hypothetical protein n=1 Tax=Paenibacillus sp. GCM10027628 TaxID=3273413 RepID=UPI00362E0364
MKQFNTAGDIVKLAAMECAASCIMTALTIAGHDYRYFLLSYWNLNYNSKIIMSGKNMRHNDLQFAYGIAKECRSGTEDDLIALLRQNNMAMLFCKASKLRFFPRNMLGHESSGFQHFILLYGYQPETGKFLVIDPVADYKGEISAYEVWDCSVKSSEIIYYSLELPDYYEQPSASRIFSKESSANLRNYSGDKAIAAFIQDLQACLQWPQDERDTWINQNNITISSIVKTRSIVWECFCDLNLMTPDEIRAGNEIVEQIVSLWTTVNFLLIKLKKNHSNEAIAKSIEQKLETLKVKELECLQFIQQKGLELYAV